MFYYLKMFNRFRIPVLAFGLVLVMHMTSAMAQTAPVQLSDAQVNQIVEAVTGAVLKEMKAGTPAGGGSGHPAPSAASGSSRAGTIEAELAIFSQEDVTDFYERLVATLRSYPALLGEISSIGSRLDRRPAGPGPLAFLGLLAASFALAVGLGYAGAAGARRWLPGTAPKGGAATIGETLRYAAASIVGFGMFWLTTVVAERELFTGQGMQTIVSHWLLSGGAQFALFYTVFLIFFRPEEPAYRIVPLDGADARAAMRLFNTVLAVVVFRSWIMIVINDYQPMPVVASGLLINNLIFVLSFFIAARQARGAITRWIDNTAMGGGSRLRHWLAKRWLGLAGTGVLTLSAIHALGAITAHTGVVAGLTGTVRIVVAMILVCAFVEFVGRRSERSDAAAKRAIPKLPGLVSQMLRVLILFGAGVYFIKMWFVDALQVMTPDAWSEFANYAFVPLGALFGGYLAIAYVNFVSARYLAVHPLRAAKLSDDGEVISKSDDSSRLRTLIPILRITSIVIIVIMTGLLTLSHLGFNITPLLAGASVIGLAISFGSQALVKDIVSGVLFLAEDSFRIGEYIECGNSRGTVEGFTLRSVRLRHQDGQIYTVPFGQLGEIINFSRDWSTVTFNMSLDRDADLDDVRSVTAKVSADVKSEFRERVLDPLKVQGVKDVTDTAIVVQFKFKSLPHDPAEIERAARSRLLKAFKENGIALSRHPWLTAPAGAIA